MHNKKRSEFTYWKRPWHKWAILIAALAQLLCLWMNIQEYNQISKSDFLTASEWTDYMTQKNWQCSISGLLIICFLGIFLIGILARSPQMAKLLETLLLLFLTLAWGVTGFTFHLFSSYSKGIFGSLILLIAFGGTVHNLLQYRKK